MKKLLLVIVIIIIAVGGFMLLSRGYQVPKQASQPQQPNPVSTSGQITISNFTFAPSELTVKAGIKVTWTNQDSVPHQIVSDPNGAMFKSDPLQNGQSYSFTFDKAGTYSYYCGIHPSMTASIVVQ